jgi:maltose alpha-D-glucosyltransferase/alpha-amylase
VQHRGDPPPALLPPERATLSALTTPPIMCELAGFYMDAAQLLGRRTAELHAALSSDTASPAFAPEPLTRDDVARVVAEATAELQRARGAITREAVEKLERRLTHMREAHGADAVNPSSARTRIHGDYHLGQVLWAESDFYILDFEGEPARPLDQRRRKESPLKDVAGMLRSFSYAAYAALFGFSERNADLFTRLEPWARAWIRWTSAAFLKGYLAVAANASFVPADRVQRASLLDLFLIEKALYELKYEMNNRPDWMRIPLRGLEELLA